MIELPRRGYGYSPSAYVDASEVAAVLVRSKHSMDDFNTTVVVLKNGEKLDTSASPEDVRRAVEHG